ncbi:MAG: hypothetical protein NVS3B7_02170 [Candidatus Elarobacter sp.]
MADRDVAAETAEDLLVEDAGDQPHLAMAVDAHPVADGEAGALLAAVLERVQPEIRKPGDVVARCVKARDAARFVQNITGRLYRFTIVRPGHVSSFTNRSARSRFRLRCLRRGRDRG